MKVVAKGETIAYETAFLRPGPAGPRTEETVEIIDVMVDEDRFETLGDDFD